jgi:GR25 family glycosyltransferase involved in LPS biosynthesis
MERSHMFIAFLLFVFITLSIKISRTHRKYNILDDVNIDSESNFDWKKTQIYYINLDRAIKRKQNVEKMLAKANISASRIPAVDGKLLDLEKYKHHFKKKPKVYDHYKKDKKHLGHFGCYLSQMKCYEEFLKTDKDYCIIFEDDMEIKSDSFKKNVEDHVRNVPKGWDVILFGYNLNDKYHKDRNKGIQMINNIINIRSFTGLHGYMINRKSAMKLLNELQDHRWYIDWNMVYLIDEGKLNVYGTYPPFVCQPAAHKIEFEGLGLSYETKCNQNMGGMFGTNSEAY